MYGSEVVQCRRCHKYALRTVLYCKEANGQNCPLLKNEQNAEKTAKVFLEALGTRSKKSRYRFPPTCGGMMHGGSSVFRTYHRGGALPSHDSLQRLTSDRQQEPLVCTAVRISDVCSKLAYALLCGDAPCAWDSHAERVKAAQNGACAVTEAFTEHGRTWNTSPTPTFVPRFRCQNALSSANMVNNSILLSGANPEKARFSA